MLHPGWVGYLGPLEPGNCSQGHPPPAERLAPRSRRPGRAFGATGSPSPPLAPGPWLAASSALARPVLPAAARGGLILSRGWGWQPARGERSPRTALPGKGCPIQPRAAWAAEESGCPGRAPPPGGEALATPGQRTGSRRGRHRWDSVSKPGSRVAQTWPPLGSGSSRAAQRKAQTGERSSDGPGAAAPRPPPPGHSGAVSGSSSRPPSPRSPGAALGRRPSVQAGARARRGRPRSRRLLPPAPGKEASSSPWPGRP